MRALLRMNIIRSMSTQQFFFAVDVIGFFSVLLFGLRVWVTSPNQPNARLIALICFNRRVPSFSRNKTTHSGYLMPISCTSEYCAFRFTSRAI
jgi:hypothetical protein